MPNISLSSLTAATLPDDILCELFEHVAAIDPAGWNKNNDKGRGKTVLGWIVVTHVCHRWRSTCLGMSYLWAHIASSFHDPSIADVILSRAGDAPLTIGVGDPSYEEDPIRLPISWGVRRLDRAHTFICNALWPPLPDDDPQDTMPLTYSYPALQRVQFRVFRREIYDDWNAPTVKILEPLIIELSTPTLVSAGFEDALPSFLSSPSALRKLKLALDHMHSVSTADILSILRMATHLEELVLNLYGLDTRPAKDLVVVLLPRLHVFNLHCRGLKQARRFLDLISAPNATEVMVDIHDNRGFSKPVANELSAFVAARHRVTPYTELFLNPSSDEPLIVSGTSLPDARHELKFSCDDDVRMSILLAMLPRHLDLAQFTTLHMGCADNFGTSPGGALDRFLGACTNVDFLDLFHEEHEETLALLARVTRASKPAMLPALNILRLEPLELTGRELHKWWDAVQDTLEKRRRKVGHAVQRLVLMGKQRSNQSVVTDWMARVEECRSRGLASEVVDERQWTLESD
ncbi:unnamed protein product [Peniophora sp. CBMAI 1063]|nr:unnamed protein product [Peniophora sp. CBMAI 1063]